MYTLPLFPITQHKLCLFVSYLAYSGLQAETISAYLSAIRHLQVEVGSSPVPTSEWLRLHYVLQSIKRAQASTSKRVRLPITAEVMKVIYSTLFAQSTPLQQFQKVLLWAACCIGYFGFMHAGEFTASWFNQGGQLALSDVAVDSHTTPTAIRLFLRKAKTDPFGNGVFIYLGKTNAPICPVVALLSYLTLHPVGDGPLLVWSDSLPLTKEQFVIGVRNILRKGGLEGADYAGHSFRIGAATSAAKAGIPPHLIKMLGCWESQAYTLYIWTPREDLSSILPLIAQ